MWTHVGRVARRRSVWDVKNVLSTRYRQLESKTWSLTLPAHRTRDREKVCVDCGKTYSDCHTKGVWINIQNTSRICLSRANNFISDQHKYYSVHWKKLVYCARENSAMQTFSTIISRLWFFSDAPKRHFGYSATLGRLPSIFERTLRLPPAARLSARHNSPNH